jgi:hypothetical protein
LGEKDKKGVNNGLEDSQNRKKFVAEDLPANLHSSYLAIDVRIAFSQLASAYKAYEAMRMI